MKIDDKGPLDVTISQPLKDGKVVSPKREKGEIAPGRSGEATQVTISSEARYLQKITALAERGDQLRAEKVNKLKEQISRQQYHVAADDVAKAVARSEISRLLGKG